MEMMTRFTRFWALCATLLALLTGCIDVQGRSELGVSPCYSNKQAGEACKETRLCAPGLTCAADGKCAAYDTTACKDKCGGACGRCADGETCTASEDCTSGGCKCTGLSSTCTCTEAACDDRRINGKETDIDCGGPKCDKCADGKGCVVGSDCESGFCTGQAGACGQCATKPNVDGGVDGPTCAAGQTICNGACTHTATDPANCGTCGVVCSMGQVCSAGKCTTTCDTGLTNCTGSCVDLKTDANNCSACGTKCGGGTTCVAGKCTTPTPTCTDGLKNQDETDVDCGGAKCPTCANGKTCKIDTDCTVLWCNGAKCATNVGKLFIGNDGDDFATKPAVKNCLDSCVAKFGVGTYQCSTKPGMIDHKSFIQCFGDGQHCAPGGEVAENYSLGTTYTCPGAPGCACSAWVHEPGSACANAGAVSHCFK